MNGGIRFVANLLLWGFVLDSAISLADAILTANDINLLTNTRLLLAAVVVLTSIVWLLLTGFCTRIEAWRLYFLALGVLWLNAGAAPVSLLLAPERMQNLDLILTSIGLGIALLSLLLVKARYGRWSFDQRLVQGHQPHRWLWLTRQLPKMLLGLVLLAMMLPFAVLMVVQQETGGFLHVNTQGVHVLDRVLVNNKQQRTRLVAMVHVGDGPAYYKILHAFAAPETLVLAEGVSVPRSGGVGAEVSATTTAKWQGFVSQPSMFDITGARPLPDTGVSDRAWVDVVNADIAFNDLSQNTQTWIQNLQDSLGGQGLHNLPLEKVLELFFQGNEITDDVLDELVNKRNAVVLTAFADYANQYEHIVIPWGAMHMPGLADELSASGYRTESEQWHRLLSWAVLVTPKEKFKTPDQPPQSDSVSAADMPDLANGLVTAMLAGKRGGWLFALDEASELEAESYFGGLPARNVGEDWPRNATTGRPMTFVAQFSRSPDNAMFFGNIRRIRLFIDHENYFGLNETAGYTLWIEHIDDLEGTPSSWTEAELAGLQSDFGDSDYGAQLFGPRYPMAGSSRQFVDLELLPWSIPGVNPSTDRVWYDVSEQRSAQMFEQNPDLTEPYDQTFIGGYPTWLQYPERPQLPFFMQIYPPHEHIWGDAGYLYLFLDPNAPEIHILLGQMS